MSKTIYTLLSLLLSTLAAGCTMSSNDDHKGSIYNHPTTNNTK